ncbi:family 16 glycosylhydrolase [Alloyangia pacifica]|uniref:family 16 glycosylhydrolase n=1 Tax=Alloyangia pacifica TaxID=311180 RepID=UPI001CFD2C89|nr:family 16 glycosylhydrolase [Alloyangia pacifica]
MSLHFTFLGRTYGISPETRDHVLVTLWVIVTFRQFDNDELILYPLALYFFWAFIRDFREIFVLIARSYVLWLFPIWWFLSLSWGIETEEILKTGLQLVLTLMICYGAVLRLSPRQLLLSVFIAAGLAGLMSFLSDPTGSTAKGVFRSKNALGTAMVLLWVSSLCMVLDPGFSRKWRLAALVGIPLSLYLILLAHSATASLFAIGTFATILFLRFRSVLAPRATLCLLFLTVGLGLLGGIYAAMTMIEIDPVGQVLHAFGKDTTLTGRTVLWQYATEEIRQHPLLGVGHGGFWKPDDAFSVARRIYDEFFKHYNSNFSFHNSYYEVAVHQGLIGLALISIATLWILARVLPVAFFASDMPAIFFSCIALINTAISFTEVALMVPFQLLFMLFVIGALLTLKERPALQQRPAAMRHRTPPRPRTGISSLSCGAGLALLLSCAVVPSGAPAQTAEGFFDDFDTFDRDRWRISDGWANGSWQNCIWSSDRLWVEEGIATLSLVRLDPAPEDTSAQGTAPEPAQPTDSDAAEETSPPEQAPDAASDEQDEQVPGQVPGEDREEAAPETVYDFACGEFHTRTRYTHGTFEARLRTDVASGINAAFFTYIGPSQNEPHDEIDVEVLTRKTDRVSLNTYANGEPRHGTVVPVPNTTDAEYNDYAFVWEPERIRWYLNGELVHEATGELPTQPQRIYFSLWSTDKLTSWMGPLEYPDRPVEMFIDWVAYTPPGETCLFPDSITCHED